jgi:tRNA(Ile)-lysidine synthase TilS/MesJ
MKIDLKKLGEWLVEEQLMEKPFCQFSESEIMGLCETVHNVTSHLDECPPYINKHGELVIPHNCHPRHHYWNGGQSIIETLEELHADETTKKRYVADWEYSAMAEKRAAVIEPVSDQQARGKADECPGDTQTDGAGGIEVGRGA